MISNSQIEQTKTFQTLIKKTPFLKNVLTNKASRGNIEKYVYQIEKLGLDYLLDKNYSNREVEIAKEIAYGRTKSE